MPNQHLSPKKYLRLSCLTSVYKKLLRPSKNVLYDKSKMCIWSVYHHLYRQRVWRPGESALRFRGPRRACCGEQGQVQVSGGEATLHQTQLNSVRKRYGIKNTLRNKLALFTPYMIFFARNVICFAKNVMYMLIKWLSFEILTPICQRQVSWLEHIALIVH